MYKLHKIMMTKKREEQLFELLEKVAKNSEELTIEMKNLDKRVSVLEKGSKESKEEVRTKNQVAKKSSEKKSSTKKDQAVVKKTHEDGEFVSTYKGVETHKIYKDGKLENTFYTLEGGKKKYTEFCQAKSDAKDKWCKEHHITKADREKFAAEKKASWENRSKCKKAYEMAKESFTKKVSHDTFMKKYNEILATL